MEIKYCPSTLKEGFSGYSPKAEKDLFGGKRVVPFLDFELDEFRSTSDIVDAIQRISVSGVQEKFPAVIERMWQRRVIL